MSTKCNMTQKTQELEQKQTQNHYKQKKTSPQEHNHKLSSWAKQKVRKCLICEKQETRSLHAGGRITSNLERTNNNWPFVSDLCWTWDSPHICVLRLNSDSQGLRARSYSAQSNLILSRNMLHLWCGCVQSWATRLLAPIRAHGCHFFHSSFRHHPAGSIVVKDTTPKNIEGDE